MRKARAVPHWLPAGIPKKDSVDSKDFKADSGRVGVNSSWTVLAETIDFGGIFPAREIILGYKQKLRWGKEFISFTFDLKNMTQENEIVFHGTVQPDTAIMKFHFAKEKQWVKINNIARNNKINAYIDWAPAQWTWFDLQKVQISHL